ncbi:MAG: hypothetical protein ACXVCY_19635 [Pseudobdellovibrionaceae bacterium]
MKASVREEQGKGHEDHQKLTLAELAALIATDEAALTGGAVVSSYTGQSLDQAVWIAEMHPG